MMNKVSILDGGFASELERHGIFLTNDPLWSARILHTNPKVITAVHKSYIQNGADIITTSSYQASIEGFMKHLNLNVEQSRQLIKLSVELAKTAVTEFSQDFPNDKKNVLTAGSVGPYGACLGDGSEYTGSYLNSITHEELKNWHRPRIECLVEAGVDILAFETLPGLKEAEALISLLKEFPNANAWLSFSSQSMHKTCFGEEIASSVKKCSKMDSSRQLVACGLNCCPPDCVESLLCDITDVSPTIPLIVYPNSGEVWDSKIGWTGDKTLLNSSYLGKWMEKNVKIIGGCCQTYPEDILKIAQFVKSFLSQKVL